MPEILHNTLKINERIKSLREKNNLKQEGFAEKIGAKRGNVAQWEAGNNYPALDYLTKICEVFNVTADWLLFGINQAIKKDVPDSTPLNEIVNVLKELAESVKHIEASLVIVASNTPYTLQQNHSSDTSSNEHKSDAQDAALTAQTELNSQQQETIQKRKRESQQGE